MDFSRRQFLGVSAGGFATFCLQHGLSPLFAQQDGAKAKAVIVLWMDGGPSQIDTFDPKPGRPNGGKFQAIETAAKDIRVSEHLPRLAKKMDRASVIRTVNSREQDHGRAAYLMHTGYANTALLVHPGLGSIVSHELGSKGVPAYVSIRSDAAFAFYEAGPGFLGPMHAPFTIDNPSNPGETVRLLGRDVRERVGLLEDLNLEFRRVRESDNLDKRRSFLAMAKGLRDSAFSRALDLSQETEKTVRAYIEDNDRYRMPGGGEGPASKFGLGCVLARRLVEAGVRCVEVNLGGWDTHADNFNSNEALLKVLDPAFAALIGDLERHDLLESTLVVWAGEFGRTPAINQANGRDHFPNAYSVVLAGGGVQPGRVIGDTGQDGAEIAKDPVSVPDLFATIAALCGIHPDKRYDLHDSGAVRITDKGKPVKDLLTK